MLDGLFNLLTDNIVPGHFLHGIKKKMFTCDCVGEVRESNMISALRLILNKINCANHPSAEFANNIQLMTQHVNVINCCYALVREY